MNLNIKNTLFNEQGNMDAILIYIYIFNKDVIRLSCNLVLSLTKMFLEHKLVYMHR